MPEHTRQGAGEVRDTLPEELRDLLDRFRATAAERGLPPENVERWLRTARRGAMLYPEADGPVVGRFGGPLMLPPGMPAPGTSDTDDPVAHQLIATIDLAAIPEGATDLPLPSDGHLLLFAVPELGLEVELAGSAVYLPAGVPVEERRQDLDYEPYEYDSPEDLDADLRGHGELRLARAVSLPLHSGYHDLHFRSDLARVWDEAAAELRPARHVPLQIGGNAADHEGWGDPVRGSATVLEGPEDWVLLAQWEGLPMATVYWTMPRQDLAELRFDRVLVQMYANP
ncbi:DUF1963 domain-containing protein [Nonomuraea sp. LP-02]|uniref:DUF1963 domain-containing protein n=1 Tax=Nonomuraea sp. LP-02 TaxID=3097960 RepID=UPI002E3458BC|nr:DUF1963 domain-containing protein [Nonomuraea sp. LP-02]MED7923860.1 DUF1963 domain-containing protein [Nonomuraea sp. LP-02]